MMPGMAPALPPIEVPACVRRARHDPLFPSEFTGRLGETFATLDLGCLEGVGHFPHVEDPGLTAHATGTCFARGFVAA